MAGIAPHSIDLKIWRRGGQRYLLLVLLQLLGHADQALELAVVADAEHRHTRAPLIARYPSSDDVYSGVCAWASGMASVAYEHAVTPVLRIGAIAWLAHVALAGVVPPVMGGAS